MTVRRRHVQFIVFQKRGGDVCRGIDLQQNVEAAGERSEIEPCGRCRVIRFQMDPAHFRQQGHGISGQKIHHGIIHRIVMRLFPEQVRRFPNAVDLGGCLLHVLRVDAHFVKKQMVEAFKVLQFPQAFGKIGPQQGLELQFIGRVDQLELLERVEDFGGGDAQPRGPAAGNKLPNQFDHKSPRRDSGGAPAKDGCPAGRVFTGCCPNILNLFRDGKRDEGFIRLRRRPGRCFSALFPDPPGICR